MHFDKFVEDIFAAAAARNQKKNIYIFVQHHCVRWCMNHKTDGRFLCVITKIHWTQQTNDELFADTSVNCAGARANSNEYKNKYTNK